MKMVLIKEYWLIGKDNTVLPITIQEESKEDFKKLMGWDEKKFKKHTCVRHKRKNKNTK